MATGEVRVLSLGDKGVHAETGPLHGDLGDVIFAKNASFFGDGQRGGLHKRMGLAKLTSATCAGAVYSIFAVTFNDPTPGAILTDDAIALLTDESFLTLTE